MKNNELGCILDVGVKCPVCPWSGKIGDTEPDVDGDGSPGCPNCLCNVVLHQQEIPRVLIVV